MNTNISLGSGGSRPPSITRSFRDNYSPDLETLPPEITHQSELSEEIEELEKSDDEEFDQRKDGNSFILTKFFIALLQFILFSICSCIELIYILLF